jgi:hypothetical protein
MREPLLQYNYFSRSRSQARGRHCWTHQCCMPTQEWVSQTLICSGCFSLNPHKIIILRVCEHLDLSCSCISNQPILQAPKQSRHPERSASQIYRIKELYSAESKDPEDAYLTHAVRSFSPLKPLLADPPRSLPWAEDKKCRSCTRASWLKSLEPHRQDKHPRGPSTPRYRALCYAIDLRCASLRMTALLGACKIAGWICGAREIEKVTGSQDDGFVMSWKCKTASSGAPCLLQRTWAEKDETQSVPQLLLRLQKDCNHKHESLRMW